MGRNTVPAPPLPVAANLTCITQTVGIFSNAVSLNEKVEAEKTHPSQQAPKAIEEGHLLFVQPPYNNPQTL